MSETIFAPATAPGRGAITIIRLSGPATGAALDALTGTRRPPARQAVLRRLCHPRSGELLDQGLVLWFPAPASYTGQDMAELQLHGGRAVLGAMTEALSACPGLRPAEPGEFTRRAFENGRLDLTEVEAVADLIAAETEAQRRQALRQLDGELSALYDSWRQRLLRTLAHLEAEIDFAEEDLPAGLASLAHATIQDLAQAIASHLADQRRGERLRDGLHVAIIGPPNAGKSSLLNALARREVAIVSARSGTTRDVIEVHLDLAGYPVVIADTAGLRASEDEIEQEGIRRAGQRAVQADVRIAVFDARDWPELDATTLALVDEATIPVLNKTDLRPLSGVKIGGREGLTISVATGEGLSELVTALTAEVADRLAGGSGPALTRERHRAALTECHDALCRAANANEIELCAEDLRLAGRALGRITGRLEVEEMLELIFREFCIGK
jgi:tRNA modification GTPase